jgi:hemoglobin
LEGRKLSGDRVSAPYAIQTVITDVIRLHRENPTIMHLMEGVDDEHLIVQVTDFISLGAGGDVEYHGKDMVTAHENLGLTDELFLSAGGDLQAAMEAAGVGENEIQEVMCMFGSLHGDVVRS